MSANMFLQNPEPQPNSTQASVPELPKNTSKLQDFTNNNLQKISESNNSKKTNEHTPQKTNESRIPVPASPVLLRRQYSLRLKGEKASGIIGNRRFSLLQEDKIQNDENSKGKQTEISGKSVSNQQLHRGRSFTDRRENTNERSQIHNRKSSTPNASMQANSSNSNKSYTNSSQRLRSLSMSSSTTRTYSPRSPKICTSSPNNSTSADNRHNFSTDNLDALNWDNESITSIGSSIGCCDHSSIARNGTTFSGRSMKYVFHCNQHLNHEGDDYLTPTQRAQRQVKKLKYMLHQAKKGLDQKDSEILKLTKEVVELRLHKANLDCSNIDGESKKIETKKSESPEDISFTDSGHFDDGTNSSQHSKDLIFDDINSPSYSKSVETFSKSFTTKIEGSETHEKYLESNNLIMEYEKKIQDLVKSHDEEVYNLKQTQNVKVEELLQRISEINSRYLQLVPDLETGKEQIQNLEYQLEEAGKKLQEQENSAKTTYLKMYAQGQEAARQERENSIMELARHHPSRVTVPELLQELEVTKNELENIKDVEYASSSNNSRPLLSAKEALSLWVLGARKAMYRQLMEARSKNKIDPEITLQFLKSAVYYFLTDKENSQGHLKAIESILGYTPKEISNIDKARNS